MDTTNKDRRIKREIANSNERRRMQSINAGFHKLKSLLPVNDGEKISKANILQHAADFITTIERDRLMLHEQNTLLRQLIKDLKFRSENKSALDNVNLDVLPTIPLNPRVAIAPGRHRNTKICDESPEDERIMSASNRNNVNATSCIERSIPRSYQRQKRLARTTRNTSKQTKNVSCNDGDTTAKAASKYVAQIISDKVSSQDKNVAKAAIALPLEVPYTSETIIGQNPQNSTDLQEVKTEAIVSMPGADSQESGQNLDTICKAIMEIEGDRVFKDETSQATTT